jgi:hypothetical protein
VTYPCTASEFDKSSPYAQRCAEGVQDRFELTLWVDGRRLCGTHAATAHVGNRVDEDEDWTPSLLGTFDRNSALVKFQSHWGGSGHARLERKGGKLYWDVVDQDGGTSWMPDHAVLSRKPDDALPTSATCPEKLGDE